MVLLFLVITGGCIPGFNTNTMAVTTVKVTDLISPFYVDLIPNCTLQGNELSVDSNGSTDQIYNLLVNENGKTVDIRCRVISKSKNRILIFKVQG